MPCCIFSAETIKSLPIFSASNDAELTSLLPSLKRRTFEPGSCILRAGDTPDGLYVIVSGSARLVHHDREGRALIAEVFKRGDLFGEMGLIDATSCPASVIAVEACEVVFISRETTPL